MSHVIIHSLIDAIKVLPVVFLVYVIIEFLESKHAGGEKLKKIFGSNSAPLVGGVIGIVPQCGFSVVATKLYSDGYIYLGTLLAVYFATSDEAIPIILSNSIGNSTLILKLGLIILIKVLYGILVGFLVNFIAKKITVKKCEFSFDEEVEFLGGCCGHGVGEKPKNIWQFLVHPIIHSLKIVFFIFLVNLILGLVIDLWIGEEVFYNLLGRTKFLQPLFCVLFGLIPNCASSVLLSQLFSVGAITFSGALCGLTANSGLGLALLFKSAKTLKKGVVVLGLVFLFSLILGYGCLAIEILI